MTLSVSSWAQDELTPGPATDYHLLVDENIPYAHDFFNHLGRVTRVSGRSLQAKDLAQADALVIRSITQVDAALLAQAPKLKFVGTCTAGCDHVNQQLLMERNIHFSHAPGCNAAGVADYVVSAISVMAQQQGRTIQGLKAGIVGMGQIGSRLYPKLKALGLEVLICDPPLEQSPHLVHEDWPEFSSLDELVAQVDILTVHVPLTKQGEHATWDLISAVQIEALKPNAMLINAARGGVVDEAALKARLISKSDLFVALDCWYQEPDLDTELMSLVNLATPHIAGYSLEGKARGTSMIYQALCQFLAIPPVIKLEHLLPQAEIHHLGLSGEWSQDLWERAVRLVYDVRRDDGQMRYGLSKHGFDWLRKNYLERREFHSLYLQGLNADAQTSAEALGFLVGGPHAIPSASK